MENTKQENNAETIGGQFEAGVIRQNNGQREISIGLERHIKKEFRKVKPLLNKRIKELKDIQSRYVVFPIAIDGVIDMVRYDTKTKKFDQIEITVATKGIEAGFLPYTVYCDEYKRVVLSI